MNISTILDTNKTLLICPKDEQTLVLKELQKQDKLYDIKIMDLDEFIKHYYFSYDEKTIMYCFNKFNLSYDTIIEYLNILPYLNKESYVNHKLQFLLDLKNELSIKKLLIKDELFKTYLNQVKIIVYDYPKLDDFYIELFKEFNNISFFYKEEEKKKLTVNEAESIDDEIVFVFSKIIDLTKKNISLSNIHLMNITDEYLSPLYRLSKWFNIPIKLPSNISLWDIPTAKEIYNYLCHNNYNDIVKYLDDLKESEIKTKIMNILNNYNGILENYPKRNKLLKEIFKHTKIELNSNPGIDILSVTKVNSEDYYFLLGMNKENIPKIDKSENILNDTLRNEIGLLSSVERNKIEKQRIKDILYSTNNLIISYKKMSTFNSFNPSLIIEEEQMNVEKIKITFSSSAFFNKMKLLKCLDYFYRYGKVDGDIQKLYDEETISKYKTYNNQFTGINKNDLLNYLNNKLLLSYSSLDNYFRCGFRYYLTNILKLDKFEDTFYTAVGNIFHKMLSICFTDTFNFSIEFDKEVSNYNFNKKEILLINKLKTELEFDIKVIKNQMNLTHFDNSLYEKKFYLDVKNKDNVNVTMMGIIDKILYLNQNNKTYASIIDYKTGTLPDRIDMTIYGIGMQLPIYYHLLKHTNILPNVKIVGMFLQKIINQDNKYDKAKDYLEEKAKKLKLVGYATSNEYDLSLFDMSYQDSGLIKSMKVGNTGFYKYSKVLSEEKLNQLDNIVSDKIEEAANSILNANFDINPKRIGKINVGCEFCKYKDICFLREENIISLKEDKKLEFLGGDVDA